MRLSDRCVLLLGLGRFGGGVAAARYLLAAGARVRVCDRSPPESLRASMDRLGDHPGVEWCLGREDPALLRDVDLVVANPAVPQDNPLLLASREHGVETTQEVNLFLDAYPGQIVLVTGTNGKSTTATLLASALQAGGLSTLLGGNIGNSLLDARSHWRAEQVAVLEISSFQLERVCPDRHHVLGTVFTRVTKDHLDRHGSVAAYRAAKARAATLADGFWVHCADDKACSTMTSYRAQRITYTAATPAPGQLGVRDGWLWADLCNEHGPILHPDALLLAGRFQIENALAAAAAACMLGVERHAIGVGLCQVEPLPHRLQLIAQLQGVRIYDNGVSTQMESTLVALDSVPGQIHWVGGGKSKGGSVREFMPALSTAVASAHLFGSSAADVAAALQGKVPTTVHEHLCGALDAALRQARAGEAILFSPAFASHDQFVNYAARARRFHAWVEQRQPAGVSRSQVPRPGLAPPTVPQAGRARSRGGLEAWEG
ncbi:MAG: UDP-N-acetylmuramoyl-L-alanine--D-glutamate ligase [Planctomycetota bacterium]|jgi:UDP-N-acetylmuramoylalanine--D-glutamate ligase